MVATVRMAVVSVDKQLENDDQHQVVVCYTLTQSLYSCHKEDLHRNPTRFVIDNVLMVKLKTMPTTCDLNRLRRSDHDNN